MNEKTTAATLTVVSVGAGLSLFLPSMEKAHEASPSDQGFKRLCRSGGAVYALAVLALAIMESKAVGSPLPFAAGLVLVALVLGLLETHRASEGEQKGATHGY